MKIKNILLITVVFAGISTSTHAMLRRFFPTTQATILALAGLHTQIRACNISGQTPEDQIKKITDYCIDKKTIEAKAWDEFLKWLNPTPINFSDNEKTEKFRSIFYPIKKEQLEKKKNSHKQIN